MMSKLALFVIVLGIFILTGCTEKTDVENKSEKVEESTKKEEVKKEVKQEVEKPEGNKEIVVNVIDPNTKSIIKTYKPTKEDLQDSTKYKADIQTWAKEIARGTDTQPGYDQRNTPDRIGPNGEVIKGSPRVILEEEQLVNMIMEASAKGGDVTLPLTITESGYNEEDVALLSEVVVASYTTYFNPGVAGRTRNIQLSAEAINNVIVGTNDFFSFNTTVGPSDEAHGYQPAEEAVNGQLVMGIGGGICQTSSTLYNAVDQLKVQYVEKHNHSVTVGYVPVGRDATVSYGGKDFRFQNTANAPFLIKAIVGQGTLTVELRTAAKYEQVLKN
jgi:vancomycin resistance protein YoaR